MNYTSCSTIIDNNDARADTAVIANAFSEYFSIITRDIQSSIRYP